MEKCPKCGAEGQECLFCDQCGAALTTGPVSCPNCSANNPADAEYCDQCGNPLPKLATTAPAV